MEEDLELAIVRINKADNSVAGSGFLISEKHIMTCTHVIAYALGFTPKDLSFLEDKDLLNKEVKLVFAIIDLKKSIRAKIVKWYPVTSDQKIKDIAVLEIIDDIEQLPVKPCAVSVLSTKNRNLHQHKFDALGFPKGSSSGKWVEGKIMGAIANSLIQIQGENIVGGRIEQGFSGTAIWDRELKAIVGMATKEAPESTEKIGFMKPTEILIEAWGNLAKHCRDDAFSEFVQILKKYEADIKEVINLKWAYYQSISIESSNLGNDRFNSLDDLVNALVKIEKNSQKQKILLAEFASLILLRIKNKEEETGILNDRLTDFRRLIKTWIEVHTCVEDQTLIAQLEQKYTTQKKLKTYLLIYFVEGTEKISIKSWFVEGKRWKNLEPSQSRFKEKIENCLTLKEEQLSQIVENLKLQCIDELSSSQELNCINYFLPLKLLEHKKISMDSLELLKIESDNPYNPPSCLDHDIAIRLNRAQLKRQRIKNWKDKGNKLRGTKSNSFLKPVKYENSSTLFDELNPKDVWAVRLTNVMVREDIKDVLMGFLWAGIPLGIWEKMVTAQ